jgi:hypothetical protein
LLLPLPLPLLLLLRLPPFWLFLDDDVDIARSTTSKTPGASVAENKRVCRHCVATADGCVEMEE